MSVRNGKEIGDWLVDRFAEVLALSPRDIDHTKPFSSYGLSSREMLALVGDLEQWLDRTFSETIVYDYPTIESLSVYLAGESA